MLTSAENVKMKRREKPYIVTADFADEREEFSSLPPHVFFWFSSYFSGRESDAENHRRIRRWESFHSVLLPDFTESSRKENWGIS